MIDETQDAMQPRSASLAALSDAAGEQAGMAMEWAGGGGQWTDDRGGGAALFGGGVLRDCRWRGAEAPGRGDWF